MSDAAQTWDRRLAERQWPSDADPFLAELAGPLPAGRVLDLRSGVGRNSLRLAAQGWAVTTVGASSVALARALDRGAQLGAGVDVIHADVTGWHPGQQRHALAVVAYLHPGADGPAAVLTSAAATLVPGGHLFVIGHDLATLGRHGPPDTARLLTRRPGAAMPPQIAVEMLEREFRQATDTVDAAAGVDRDDAVVLVWGSRRR